MSPVMKKSLLFILAALLMVACKREVDLSTTFERSDFTQTDDYDGTVAYAKLLAKSSPQVSYKVLGQSAQGRDIPMLIVDEDGRTDVKRIRQQGKNIILVEACIHPGEPNGKDAGFMLIRDMLADSAKADLLKHFTLLFIPVLNPDGLADFSPYNRINQNGPEKMGWRVTAQGLNLNRDFTKLDSPELRAFVSMFNQWQPDLFFDTHATNGADYQYVTTYSIEDFGNYDPALSRWLSDVWEPKIVPAMARHDMPITRYIEFHPWGDPTAALYDESFSAMFSESYATSRNCPGILLETHMLKPYKERVFSTYNMMVETLKIIRNHKESFNEALAKARNNDLQLTELPINMRPSTDTTWVDFLGYEYDTVQSNITGGWYYAYDPTKPETRRTVKFRSNQPEKSLQVPKEYVIPVQYDQVIDIVKAHGFVVNELKKEKTMTVNAYKFKNVKCSSIPYEGRCRVTQFEVEEMTKEMTFPKGSLIVKAHQNGVRLLMNLLEPEMQGSLFEWGFFNTCLQRVEYFEMYKMEPMARQMLEADPLLKTDFETWMASFGAGEKPSQHVIMNWFYEHSPYFDANFLLYPVGIVR